jgi:putative AdoMet-dependent methyltransferase
MQEIEFNAQEFDQWAATYDQDVLEDSFPFDGYSSVLDATLELAAVEPGLRVLELGTGTGNLARRFLDLGCRLWCTDFSTAMIAQARRKLPQAIYAALDLRIDLPPNRWPQALAGPFDRIGSAYVFHHFPLTEKMDILRRVSRLLVDGGWMVISDIAFPDDASLDRIRRLAGADWEEEYYWVAEQALPALERAGFSARFHPVSSCAGVFVIVPV